MIWKLLTMIGIIILCFAAVAVAGHLGTLADEVTKEIFNKKDKDNDV